MLTHSTFHQHPVLWLANEHLQIGVLPEKGADIFALTYQSARRPAAVQFLMQTPWGLKPPAAQPPADFLTNYEGGWQELFPNAGDGCQHRGQDIPFHGEVALLPWEYLTLRDDADETALALSVNSTKLPFRLERALRLRRGERCLRIHEKITNLGDETGEFVWGHHLTLGGDFLEEGCFLEIPARQIFTPDAPYEPLTARLAASQCETWPVARGKDGQPIDLRYVPGPHIHSHDDVFLNGLAQGMYRVANPRLKLSFVLQWEVEVFPWLVVWQPYGGADQPPLTGIYGIGLEPWTSRYPLAEAVKQGQAKTLPRGQSLETELVVEIQDEIRD